MTERHFAARIDECAEFLEPVGVVPPNADELVSADEEVEGKVAELHEALSSPTGGELAELGVRFAKGELRAETVRSRISSAADMNPAVTVLEYDRYQVKSGASRRSVVVEAAKGQWRVQLDRPEWSQTALRRSCVPLVQEVMDAAAAELKESWEALPAHVRDAEVASLGQDLRSVGSDLNVNMSGAELDARKRADAVWNRWFNGGALTDVFHYLHAGRAGIRRDGDHVNVDLCFVPRDAVKFYAAGFTPSQLIVRGLIDGFEPIADPLGDDAEEYQARMDEYNHVHNWRFEFNNSVELGLNLPRARKAVLLRRRELYRDDVVRSMREAGEWRE